MPYGDPVGDLLRAAVADRPLEEVADLITMLESSPQYAQTTADVLRTAGVDRSVEDVARLVALLTRPPRQADSADEAIRAAAACRPVEDVTRLMTLLHRTPLEPHCGQEAVRAAATGRPVEDLVELIGRLAGSRRASAGPPEAEGPRAPGPHRRDTAVRPDGRAVVPGAPGGVVRAARRVLHAVRSWDPHPFLRAAPWPGRLVVVALAACGVLYFPPQPGGASLGVYAAALGLSAFCLVLSLLLMVRPSGPVLAGSVAMPATLAVAKLCGDAYPSTRLSQAVDLTLAPAWLAATVAMFAALTSLAALLTRPTPAGADGRRPAGPVPGPHGAAD
ncbi:hypothetical protein [Streptomyces glaucus]|uniref:Uncharacterized protein n=1 Tax=Streptomyces glaucus TaxID=284029 RepID=A0ABP5XUK4_9ACTN